jgi:hypothetical protein
MHPRFFGESRDIAKRQIMLWLAPDERWAAHPMWFYQRPQPPGDRAFLDQYAAALDADIVDGESPDQNTLFEASKTCLTTWRYRATPDQDALLKATETCRAHLLLDPDTGLGKTIYRDRDCKDRVTHVSFDQFIHIVKSPGRQNKLTLIYDQGNGRANFDIHDAGRKLCRLRQANLHTVAYMAEPVLGLCFIWASTNADAITEATRRMQEVSGFPSRRFVDDGCGHVR